MRTIKQDGSRVHCIVVAERHAQFQLLLDAGADKVLLKGFAAAELAEATSQLSKNVSDRESSAVRPRDLQQHPPALINAVGWNTVWNERKEFIRERLLTEIHDVCACRVGLLVSKEESQPWSR